MKYSRVSVNAPDGVYEMSFGETKFSVAVSGSELFIPADSEAFLCASADGVKLLQSEGETFYPAGWLIAENICGMQSDNAIQNIANAVSCLEKNYPREVGN